ncbi:MAG TPA: DUF6364 family protein [Treponemataceae bacterium]|jgi:DNA-directed RNA polymerase beta' subunit|nr:MAG: hypothetical protein BWY20_01826 [Spirochaetes bacterium ADurb.Bin215]HOF85999.1 DUF6364 family protein [Treponemataceae bacterium]HOS35901.1 DUF6364 family protein [Treponemataceae bacterium]HOU39490.1 DUF6364 family protein [Treponemataceae bacterium]HPL92198.1 DUF6364 family protein [Treponemataceae bacterium]
MQTKLTLTIDKNVVEQAKEYAQRKNRSVSRIVEEYLENIASQDKALELHESLPAPITESLTGMFTDTGRPYKEMLGEARQEKFH